MYFTKNAHEIVNSYLHCKQCSPLSKLISIFISTLSFYLQDKTHGYDLVFSNAPELDLQLNRNVPCSPLQKKINNCLKRPQGWPYRVKSLEWCSAPKLQCENRRKVSLSDLNAFWEYTSRKLASFAWQQLIKGQNVLISQACIPKTQRLSY